RNLFFAGGVGAGPGHELNVVEHGVQDDGLPGASSKSAGDFRSGDRNQPLWRRKSGPQPSCWKQPRPKVVVVAEAANRDWDLEHPRGADPGWMVGGWPVGLSGGSCK